MGKNKNRYYKAPVLSLISKKQPISRIRIGEITGIRLATITEVVRELLESGLVRETGRIRNRQGVGRKEKLLEIIPEGRYFLGCELLSSQVRVLALNFAGEVLKLTSVPLCGREGTSAILEKIAGGISSLVKEIMLPEKKIHGLGFVDPGIIDDEKGISVFSTIMPGWSNVPVKQYLQEKLGFRVHMINTSQAKVLAENSFGSGRNVDNLIFIEYGEGISCGIIIEKTLMGGYMEIAGEMGHFNFPDRKEKCRCGQRGCLEAIASIPAIEKRFRQYTGMGKQSFKKGRISIGDVVEASEKGDPLAEKVMNETSMYLSSAVASVVKLLNPEVVILDRNFLKLGKKFLSVFENDVNGNLLYGEKVKFRVSNLGKEQASLGGAALLVQNFLNNFR